MSQVLPVEITAAPVKHPYRWVVLGGVWLLYFSFGLTVTAMAPLVAPIREDLGLDNAQFGPIISIGAPKLVSLWFASRERGLAMGIYVTGANLSAVSGLALTNSLMMPLLDNDWRNVLFCYAAFASACGVIWFLIGGHSACRDVERRIAAEPRRSQFDQIRHLLRVPLIHLILAIGMGIFFFNHGLGNWLPEILRTGGMTPAEAGFWSAIPTAVGILAALSIPRLASEPHRITVMFLIFLSAAIATLLLREAPGPLLVAGLVLQGIARGAMTATTMLLLIELPGVGSRNTGVAGGMFFSAAEIGGVLGPLLIGYVAHATGGFSAPLWLLTADAVLLLVLLFLLKRAVR